MIEVDKITDIINHLDNLKIIVFDLDDTLYSEKEYVKSGYHAVAKELNHIAHVEEKLWTLFMEKKNAIDELLINEGFYSDELKRKCLTIYRHHKPNIHLYEGVKETLTKLKDCGYKIGIITDGRPEGQRLKIKALGIDGYIDKIIITDELGGIEYRKPNKEAFKKMKEYFDVDYCEMCYIGDNIKKDFIAPQELGMKSFWFRNEDGLYY